LRVLSSCFKKQISEQSRSEDVRRTSGGIERKRTKGQSRSEDVRRKQNEIKRKQMREQNKNESVRRTSGELDSKPKIRHNPQRSKNTYVPAIRFSRNHFVSKQTRALVRKALSLV
jgi:DNA invertase Pin-like site-specific DNA recombinase